MFSPQEKIGTKKPKKKNLCRLPWGGSRQTICRLYAVGKAFADCRFTAVGKGSVVLKK